MTLALTVVGVGGAKAQTVSNKVYSKDWTAATEIPGWYHQQNCATGFPNLDGNTFNILRKDGITVSYETQVQVANGVPTIVGNDYTVRLRIKGTVDGSIACALGNWGDGNAETKYGINVTTSIQNVDIKFTDAKVSDSWVVIWAGSYAGTLSIESVEVYCNSPLFYSYDYTGKTSFPWYHDAGWGTTPTVGDDKLEAENDSELGDPSNYMFFVADGIYTEEGKEYIVRATVKGSGTIKCNMGTWGPSVTEDLALSTDYQAVDVKFSGLPTASANHIVFQIGKYVGTVSLKKIEVLEGVRSVKVGADGYATFSADKAINVEGSGVTAYAAKVSGPNLVLTPVTEIPANTGVIIEAAEGSYDVPVIESAAAIADNDLKVSNGSIIGNSSTIYALANRSHGVGFYRVKTGVTIPAGKVYLDTSTPGAPDFLGFDGGETTSISELNVKGQTDGEFYNLAGQRVAQPTKGLYIVNGKKVVIK